MRVIADLARPAAVVAGRNHLGLGARAVGAALLLDAAESSGGVAIVVGRAALAAGARALRKLIAGRREVQHDRDLVGGERRVDVSVLDGGQTLFGVSRRVVFGQDAETEVALRVLARFGRLRVTELDDVAGAGGFSPGLAKARGLGQRVWRRVLFDSAADGQAEAEQDQSDKRLFHIGWTIQRP